MGRYKRTHPERRRSPRTLERLVLVRVVAYFNFTLVRGIVPPLLVNCNSPPQRRLCVVRKKEARGTRCILIDLRALSFLRSLRFLLLFYFYWNIQWEPSLQRREELHYKSGLSTLTRQCSPAKLLNCVTPSTLFAL